MPTSRREPYATHAAPTQAKVKGAAQTGIIFLLFCFVRAIHPTVITASKSWLPDGSFGYAYDPVGPVILKNLIVCFFAQLATLGVYGNKAWRETWSAKPMLVFGVNGFIFAFDDYLEMQSLGKMQGATYQILNQSKILVTALLFMPFKGVYQTRMQWILLISLMIAMSLYMCISTSGKGPGGDIPLVGYMYALMKVTFSCIAAVYTDKYAKEFAKAVPLPVQITQTYLVRTCTALLLSGLTPQIWSEGFFHDWNVLTVIVTLSFGLKSSSSFTVIAVLDAILKNIAECVAVLLIFFYEVFAPWVQFEFDLTLFLAAMVIILLILAYVDSKDVMAKARCYDESEKVRQAEMENF